MDQPSVTTYIVRLELQRIQTFLFAVPRLRAMLGANAMLGHAIRCELPGLAKEHGAMVLDWPTEKPPEPVQDDPLAQKAQSDWTANDDPAQALGQGVLSRDGGHLRIAFPDQPQADAFIGCARRYLAEHFPDLLFSLDAFRVDTKPVKRGALTTRRVVHLAELPQIQVCTRSGFGVATEMATEDKSGEGYISAATKAKEEAGTAFQKGDATKRDYISLLRGSMPRCKCRIPRDFDQLSDAGGYIALIHADGNRVGKRIKAYENRTEEALGEPRWLAKECTVETFFHSMRGAVRAALLAALKDVFTEPVLSEHDYLPYQLLMLGGDDLLLLCHPCYALPFVSHYAKRLKDLPLIDGPPLSIGAGVIIAKHSLPFHRLHQLAESLAGSAKRAYLQRPAGSNENDPPPERSAVDWAVLTSSWGEDPLEYRRRHDFIRYRNGDSTVSLALTAKPYFVLAADCGGGESRSLESLLHFADDLAKTDELPRSQLKDMIRSLEEGHRGAELAYAELLDHLSDGARSTLLEIAGADSPWLLLETAKGHQAAVTQLKDLIECLELRYLGRRKQEQDDE